jgi:hypothetical protein
MIYTRFGNQIKITECIDYENGWIKAIRLEDNAEKEYHTSDLKADGGFTEIDTTIKELNN